MLQLSLILSDSLHEFCQLQLLLRDTNSDCVFPSFLIYLFFWVFRKEFSLFLHNLFTYLLTSIWTHAYVSFSLGYNPLLCLPFCTSCSRFGNWHSCAIWICLHLFKHFIIFWTTRCSQMILYFPCTSSGESESSPKISGPLL